MKFRLELVGLGVRESPSKIATPVLGTGSTQIRSKKRHEMNIVVE